MKIKFVVNVGSYKNGSILELTENKARQFIGAGFAEKVIAKPKQPRKTAKK